jgi:hypothetical protein
VNHRLPTTNADCLRLTPTTDHSPPPESTDGEAANPGPRLRRRGPRSDEARLRRRNRLSYANAPTDHSSTTTATSTLTVWHCNTQGLLSSLALLTARLRLATEKPSLICLNETFLSPATAVISVEGYTVAARRDRCDGRACGGVLVLARNDVAPRVTLLHSSPTCERVWLLVHADPTPFLACAWYRPPKPGDASEVTNFAKEWTTHKHLALGTLLLGDLNLHQRRWLRHSTGGNTREGEAMETFCHQNGFAQLVKSPTRGENLLDLALTDLPNWRCDVLPPLADHCLLAASTTLHVPTTTPHRRTVRCFDAADWERLGASLEETDWSFLTTCNPTDGARELTRHLLQLTDDAIPSRVLKTPKSSHPWLTDTTTRLVADKLRAIGTPNERRAAEACTAGLTAAYATYANRTRQELQQLPPSSKKWWNRSKDLLLLKTKESSIPALRRADKTWALAPRDKAQLLEEAFAAKNQVPQKEQNAYTALTDNPVLPTYDNQLSSDAAADVLTNLRADSATGPDLLPTRLLKRCSAQLATPLRLLGCRILETGEWPDVWRTHWLMPLFKRKSVYDAANYRGIHLTSQLSKATERFLGASFFPALENADAYGEHQFAYRKKRGARDVLAYVTLEWITALNDRCNVAVYCSDVSGAFDRVDTQRLTDKLKAAGLEERTVKVVNSWLQPRTGQVVVSGETSVGVPLANQVFQGTVWGPPLWNVFFADAAPAVQKAGFTEVIYADDLNAFKRFPRDADPEDVKAALTKCQHELHTWGRANGVTFDSGKESTHLLSTSAPADGKNFRLLGVLFDPKLTMTDAIDELVCGLTWRLRALRRGQRYYSTTDLLYQYKARVLSYAEYRTSALYHATDTALHRLNTTQTRFLQELGLSDAEALLEHNLAPLCTRRDIAMLGVIHRAALGQGPPHLHRFFRKAPPLDMVRTRADTGRHANHLVDPRDPYSLEILKRSALGLVAIYNLLPASAVEALNVSTFQSRLQLLVKDAATARQPNWQHHLSPRLCLNTHPLRGRAQRATLPCRRPQVTAPPATNPPAPRAAAPALAEAPTLLPTSPTTNTPTTPPTPPHSASNATDGHCASARRSAYSAADVTDHQRSDHATNATSAYSAADVTATNAPT